MFCLCFEGGFQEENSCRRGEKRRSVCGAERVAFLTLTVFSFICRHLRWRLLPYAPPLLLCMGIFQSLYGLMRLLVAVDSPAICAWTHQRAWRQTVLLSSLIIVCFLAASATSMQQTEREKEKIPAVMLQINAPRTGRLFFFRCWCTLNFTSFLKNVNLHQMCFLVTLISLFVLVKWKLLQERVWMSR